MEMNDTPKNEQKNMPLQTWQSPQIAEIKITGGAGPSLEVTSSFDS